MNPPARHGVRRPWGAVVVRSDTGEPEAVYRASNPWVASYAARSQFPRNFGLRTWEEGLLAVLPAVLSVVMAGMGWLPPGVFLPVLFASIAAVFGMRALAGRASTSTADLADPPEPPKSLGLLRAASEAITEDARVVLEVAEEQSARKRGQPS